jgi:hypothetical protein
VDFTIESYVAVGPLRFGVSVEHARSALPLPAKAFMKAPFSAFPTDNFASEIRVHYRPPGIVTAVEVFVPARAFFQGEGFLGHPYRTCLDWLRQRDPTLTEEAAGCTSRALGIGFSAPGAQKQPDDTVQGVIAFERGYYDHPEWSVNAEKWAELTARYRRPK